MTVILYIGDSNAEGDEHKKQIRFLLQDLFANCCIILQVAQDFGRSFWARVFDVQQLNRIQYSDRSKYKK